ncbi:hypothetical protein [Undibacterium sp.]|uniref:hypothetical protein n=1 Tax=Undibacterium sp. TaxID=1914977 RepID=UPI0025FFC3D6|nr:hypothetical protein [Undibacterium sp.]
MTETNITQPSTRTPFGLKDGRVFAPTEVISGLACGCTCPGCGTLLVAKQGQTNRKWHFAHHNVIATLSCIETAIHAAAKQILLEANWLQAPEKYILVSCPTKSGISHTKSALLSPSRKIRFDYCQEEVWETNLRPDVVGYRGDRRLFVEMYFRHKVDEIKRRKLESMGLAALEIDLSELPLDAGFDEVRQRVLHDVAKKEWLFYPGEKESKATLLLTLEEEIALLNFEYDRHQVAKLRKEEKRNLRLDALKMEAELIRQSEDAEHAEYRKLPRSEKERLLQTVLGITGTWPYFLNKKKPEATAIQEQPWVWQAALFAQFIFGKHRVGSHLSPHTVIEWVTRRFNSVEGRNTDAATAVKNCLAYLCACGFLVKSSYSPYEAGYYTVVHGELEPLTSVAKVRNNTSPKIAIKNENTNKEKVVIPHWIWRASWPNREEMVEKAEIAVTSSPHSDKLLRLIESLTPHTRPAEPNIPAKQLLEQGVPMEVTLNFFVELGLALKTSKAI